MCLAERNTDRRGRSGVPFTFFRIDSLRRSRASSLDFAMMISLCRAGLADLLLDHFLDVLDALPLVRLGGTDRANLGRGLAEELAIDSAQDHQVLVDLRRHALRE